MEEVDALREEGYNVRIVVRTTERGLSSAVVRGFKEASGEAMICMDADLQVNPLFRDVGGGVIWGGILMRLASPRVGAEDVEFDYGEETICAWDEIWTWC